MKVYSRRRHRNVEIQIHFGLGKSVETICGLHLPSRHIMVSLFSGWDGAVITDDMSRVTCKRCLATRDLRLRKLIAIDQANPGIFDRDTLCGKQWLLDHALDVSQIEIDALKLEIKKDGKSRVTLSNRMTPKDRRSILKGIKHE